jgi:hypothetical protein
VRNYEPELVRRFRKASAQQLESDPASIEVSPSKILQRNPYNGGSDQVFKSLLRPRNKSHEKNRNLSFCKSTVGMTKNQDETIALDASSKDMSKYFRPDFRSMGNSYQTVAQTEDK